MTQDQLNTTRDMTPNQQPTAHKQYLIDSIAEMEAFIDKIIGRLYDGRETMSQSTANVLNGIIDRKKANIAQFKALLQSQYNTAI